MFKHIPAVHNSAANADTIMRIEERATRGIFIRGAQDVFDVIALVFHKKGVFFNARIISITVEDIIIKLMNMKHKIRE